MALGLLVGSLTLTLTMASTGPAHANGAEVSVASVDCAKVAFVGAAGSGELDATQKPQNTNYLGKELNSLQRRIAQKRGAQFDLYPIKYPAMSTAKLWPSKAELAGTTLVAATYWKWHLGPFMASVDKGVTKTVTELTRLQGQCHGTRTFVLAGYSQGAMVMHRAMNRLATTATGRQILSRVVGVVLLADGDRVSNTRAQLDTGLRGDPAAGRRGVGIATAFHRAPEGDIPVSMAARTINVCSRGDVVCDFRGLATALANPPLFKSGFATHSGYTIRGAGIPPNALARAGDTIARSLARYESNTVRALYYLDVGSSTGQGPYTGISVLKRGTTAFVIIDDLDSYTCLMATVMDNDKEVRLMGFANIGGHYVNSNSTRWAVQNHMPVPPRRPGWKQVNKSGYISGLRWWNPRPVVSISGWHLRCR